LSAASANKVTVAYATKDGTAKAGSDYTVANGTLTIAAGTTTEKIKVTVNGDTAVEPDESFTLQLSSPVNATIAKAVGTGTIRNDDSAAPPPPPPTLPDLVVQSIDGLSTPGENFGACKVTFTIKNQGNGAAGGSTARVTTPTGISSVAVATTSTPGLSADQSIQLSATLTVACDSIGALTVTADVNGDISESNEGNNSRQGP